MRTPNAATVVPQACLCNILDANCPLTVRVTLPVRVTHKYDAPVKLSHNEKLVP
jgi:hypothetical protein